MDILQNLAAGIAHLASPEVWLFIILGVAVGIVFGAIPGLTATTALAMFTPLTFALSRYPAFGFLLGIYCGGYYAGSIPPFCSKHPALLATRPPVWTATPCGNRAWLARHSPSLSPLP